MSTRRILEERETEGILHRNAARQLLVNGLAQHDVRLCEDLLLSSTESVANSFLDCSEQQAVCNRCRTRLRVLAFCRGNDFYCCLCLRDPSIVPAELRDLYQGRWYLTKAQAFNLFFLVHECPMDITTLNPASLNDMAQGGPPCIYGPLENAAPVAPEQFILDMRPEAFRGQPWHKGKKLSSVWKEVEPLLSAGDYIRFTFLPNLKARASQCLSLLSMIADHPPEKWDEWCGTDLDQQHASLVCLCQPGPGNELPCTPYHLERAEALNVAFALEGSTITDGPLAVWVFVPPTQIGNFQERLDGLSPPQTLQRGVTLDLSLASLGNMAADLGVVVVHQRHGQVVKVPAGWLHAIFNRSPNLRLSWEYMERNRVAFYPTVQRLIGRFMGPLAPDDCVPLQTAALNIASNHYFVCDALVA